MVKKCRVKKLKHKEDEDFFLHPPMTKHQIALYNQRKTEQASVFLRIDWRKKVNGLVLKAANYPMASPAKSGWKEIHDWCGENLRNKFNQVEYTWTGEKFWFATEAVKHKFVEEWGDNSGNS